MADGGIGRVWDCPPGEYHGDVQHVSRSMLLTFRASRALYAARYVHRTMAPDEPTVAMSFGTLAHLTVLQPDEFARRYCVAPKVDRRTREGKAAWEDWQAAHAGQEPISAADADAVAGIVQAIRGNKRARRLLESCRDREHTVCWPHDKTGLMLKARRDARRPGLVVDLKLVRDPSPWAFARQVVDYLWHVQAALYLDSERALTGEADAAFAFVAVRKELPHEVAIYELGNVGREKPDGSTESAIDLGRREYERTLAEIAECHATGDWRNPWEREPKMLDLPPWAGNESEWR